MTTEYYSDNINEEIDIEMEELFSSSDIYRVIQYTKDILISPSIFMNIKLYNNGNYACMDLTDVLRFVKIR